MLAQGALIGAGSGLLALLARAVLRRGRYWAEGVLAEADLAALRDQLERAEQKTAGEIVVVVLERSDDHPAACWLAALCSVLLASALLVLWQPSEGPLFLLGLQLALGGLGWLAARLLADFQRFFVSEGRASAVAEEQAFQEFHRYGLHHTAGRTGVLLFVSLFERRAIVLADEGIAARARPETWARTNELVLAGIRHGSLRAGLLEGIQSAGGVLAQHVPPAGADRNEIPDHVIVRRE